MTGKYEVLQSRLFVFCLAILLLNDFYWKACYGNWLTGKLSDVAGLFVLPLFLIAVFPRKKVECFLGSALFFLFWKLPVSASLIGLLNDLGLPVGRIVDPSDLIALAILPIAWWYEKSNFKTVRIKPHIIASIVVFAFCATSILPREERKYTDVNKTYEFNYSRTELISRLNKVSIKILSRFGGLEDVRFDAGHNLFYNRWSGDTIAVLLDERSVGDRDTIRFETVLADIRITGNDSLSRLHFINAYRLVPAFSDENYREKAIKEFEKRVVKKLKRGN